MGLLEGFFVGLLVSVGAPDVGVLVGALLVGARDEGAGTGAHVHPSPDTGRAMSGPRHSVTTATANRDTGHDRMWACVCVVGGPKGCD